MTYIPPQKFRYTQLTTPDQSTIVTLAEAKAHAIVDDTGDAGIDAVNDALVTAMIKAAVQNWIDFTGVYPLETSFRASLDFTPCVNHCWLKHPPVTVTKIFGLDTDATETELLAAEYAVNSENGVVTSYEWPSGDADYNNFNIEYTTGLDADVASVPDVVKIAVKMMVSHWFQHRESVSEMSLSTAPHSALSIMQIYKPARL